MDAKPLHRMGEDEIRFWNQDLAKRRFYRSPKALAKRTPENTLFIAGKLPLFTHP
jgi:hypothetical protein